VLQATNAKLQHWFKMQILAHAISLQQIVTMENLAPLIHAMLQLVLAPMFSPLHLNALLRAKLMHNALNGQLTTNCTITVKSQLAIKQLELALLKAIPRPIV
jgi:hypothetical protein